MSMITNYRVEDSSGIGIGTVKSIHGGLIFSLPLPSDILRRDLAAAITRAIDGGETSLTVGGQVYRLREYYTPDQVRAGIREQEAAWAAERQAAVDSCADPAQAEVWIGSAIEPRLAARRAKDIPGVLTVVAIQVYASSQAEADERIHRWHAGDRHNPWNRN